MKHPPSVKNLKTIKFLDKVPFFDSDTFSIKNADINRMIKKETVISKKHDNYVCICVRNEKYKILPEYKNIVKYKDFLSLSEYCLDRDIYLSPNKDEVYGIALGIEIGKGWTSWISVDFGLLFGDYPIPKSKNLMSTMYPKSELGINEDEDTWNRDKILNRDTVLRIYGFGGDPIGLGVYLDDDYTKPVFLASLKELD